MSDITVKPLRDDLSFGARIGGVTRDNVRDAAVRAKILAVFEDRGVIVFEDIEQSSDMLVAVSEIVGPLMDHATKGATRSEGVHGLIDIGRRARREVADRLAGRRIDAGNDVVPGRIHPLAADEELLANRRRYGQDVIQQC